MFTQGWNWDISQIKSVVFGPIRINIYHTHLLWIVAVHPLKKLAGHIAIGLLDLLGFLPTVWKKWRP